MDKEVNRTCITTPMGKITISEHTVIQILNGLLGFEEYHDYVIYDDENARPFKWLISLDNPTIHFVVVDPLLFFHDYAPRISKTDLQTLKVETAENRMILSLVTLAEGPENITVNLNGPIYVNSETKKSKQIALTGDAYSTRQNLFKTEHQNVKEEQPC
ncbi:flagellar assembly protein FliW [bacterium]|nr:flagellar assembly protein FliW [bacterium]